MIPAQLTTVENAINRIKDGAVISFNGIGAIGLPELFFPALEKKFMITGHPCKLNLYSACGLGSPQTPVVSRIKHDGMFASITVGYIAPYAGFLDAIKENRIEAYNLPQGIISRNYREAAAHRDFFLSKVGLNTFIDPRHEGSGLNCISDKNLVELAEIGGEGFLRYNTVYPDVCVLRGTHADSFGNITMEKEVNVADAFAIAMAVRNNNGLVMVQVESVKEGKADPRSVIIPGALVDIIWTNENQYQTALDDFVPCFCGEETAEDDELVKICREALAGDRFPGKKTSFGDRVIARRAAIELRESRVANLGIGLPMMIAPEAKIMGILDGGHRVSIETGVLGGIPEFKAFGAAYNPDAIYSMADQFDFYEGGGADTTFVGALQIDMEGNVNVIRTSEILMGAGGFQHVTHSAQKVVVCSHLRRGSDVTFDENGTPSLYDGKGDKFVEKVESIAMNGQYFKSLGKKIMYITERAVFELDEGGLVMTEIAPYLDPERDVLSLLPFKVKIHPKLKTFPEECYGFVTGE